MPSCAGEMCLSLYLSLREVEGGQEDCYGVGRYLGPRRGARAEIDGESSAARPARLPACWLSALVLVATWPLPAACSLARYKYTVQDAEGADFRVGYKLAEKHEVGRKSLFAVLPAGTFMRGHALLRHALAASLSTFGPRSRALMSTSAITPRERFLFDLNGFLVVRGVFTPEEVAAANAAIDKRADSLQPRDEAGLRNAKSGTPLSATGPRIDAGGMLYWPDKEADLFRDALVHPKLVPYYTELMGEGYRLDHQPLLVVQDGNSEGFSLHGGPVANNGTPLGAFSPELQYRFSQGQMWTSLLAISVQLCDHDEGDGGFCIVRGSHKLNLPVPADMANGVDEAFAEHVYQPRTKAGDVVIWSEATVHGATPWRGAHQRRIAIYRFAPCNMGYGRGYLEVSDEQRALLTDLQKAVVEPPYSTRLERPLVTAEAARDDANGPAPKKARSEAKKAFDRKLFGTSYF